MKLQKETSTHGKWYDDACGAAFALELIGERWSALVMREMMFGPRRFTDLRAGLPSISAKVLTARLEGLEQSGLVRRRQLAPPAASQVYELTPLGQSADGLLLEMCRWSFAMPGWDRSLPTSSAALMLSMRALFDADAAAGLAVEGTIRIAGDTFRVSVADSRFKVERSEDGDARFVISAPSTGPLRRLVYGKVAPEDLSGFGLSVTGDESLALQFIDLFHLPKPVL
ncbi:MAG: helix-turn-helix domain-containing protein [Novosphingobium sp.]